MEEEVTFYSNVKGLLAVSLLIFFFFLGGIPFSLQNPTVGYLYIITAVCACGPIVVLLARKRTPVIAKPDGLSAYTVRGGRHFVEWSIMSGATTEGNLKPGPQSIFVELKSPIPKSLSIPLFLEDQQKFYDYVCTHAPANNPLRVWIEALPERKPIGGHQSG